MQPREFEKFATGLAKNCNKRNFRKLIPSNPSACYRSAISRLYYGILHQIKDWLAQRNDPIKEEEKIKIHRVVREKLKSHKGQKTADTLKRLHELRKLADYELDTPVGYSEWEKALYYANILKRRLRL